MHVAGSSGDIGIVVVCARGIVDTCPAGGECLSVSNGAVVRVVLKAVLIRQGVDERTWGVEVCGKPHAGVCPIAQRGYTHRVHIVGREADGGIEGVVHHVGQYTRTSRVDVNYP